MVFNGTRLLPPIRPSGYCCSVSLWLMPAMARALVVKPSLILADEPTGQLDSNTSAKFLETVLALIDGSKTALLIATHDLSVARRMKREWKIEDRTLRSTVVPDVSWS